jgi:thymidylate kinase
MFISLEGIDGAGKTSVASVLAERENLIYLNKKSSQISDPFVAAQFAKIKDANYPGFNGEFDHLLSPRYWLYLQCVWYTVIYDNCVRPHLERGKTVIVDGWIYKFIAKVTPELDHADLLGGPCSLVPAPDRVVMLDVAPSLALKRKGAFTHYEAGSHTGHGHSEDNFVRFQTEIRARLLAMQDARWTVLPVAEHATPAALAGQIADQVCVPG